MHSILGKIYDIYPILATIIIIVKCAFLGLSQRLEKKSHMVLGSSEKVLKCDPLSVEEILAKITIFKLALELRLNNDVSTKRCSVRGALMAMS